MLGRLASGLFRSPPAASPLLRLQSRSCVVRSIVTPETICRDWTPQSRRVGAVGMKCGMTQVRATVHPAASASSMPGSHAHSIFYMRVARFVQAWSANGTRIPITVIELQDLQVAKVRVPMKDGVCALQLAGGWEKRKHLTYSEARNYESKGLSYKRYMREFPVTEDALLPVRSAGMHSARHPRSAAQTG